MSGTFQYLAIEPTGRKVSGQLSADNAHAAHAMLRRQGLVALRLAEAASAKGGRSAARIRLKPRQMADFLFDLSALCLAGVDMRAALAVLAQSSKDQSPASRAARALAGDVAAGSRLEAAFRKVFGPKASAVSGLIAAGEASGDLGGALKICADNLEQELEALDGVLAAISYPLFILLMSFAAIAVILLFVIPTLAPLAEASTQNLPTGLRILFAASDILRTKGPLLALAGATLITIGVVGWRWGGLRRILEQALIDGPIGVIARPLVFGGVMATTGALIAAKVPAADALAIAQQTTALKLVRDRLGECGKRVREGEPVSAALAGCRGAPMAAVRLAAIGENVGRLGEMLERSGRFERKRALRSLRAFAQWLGPILIVLLGAMVGTIMATLLTSITALGDVATSG